MTPEQGAYLLGMFYGLVVGWIFWYTPRPPARGGHHPPVSAEPPDLPRPRLPVKGPPCSPCRRGGFREACVPGCT